MNFIKYTLYIILVIYSNYIYSQDNSKLIISTEVIDNKVHINWYPNDPLKWKDGLKDGYLLSREMLNAQAGTLPNQTILPKSKEWFRTNVKSTDGVIFPIGELLYNPEFSLSSSDNSESWKVKYNYIVYESTVDHEVANAVGLAYVDSTIVKGTKYKYTVKHIQSGLSNSIEITVNDGEENQSPKDFEPNFTFPDGNSLSYLIQLSQPFVLNAVIGKARPMLDSIILRWGPSTPEIWRNAMADGYDVFRIDENNKKIKLTTVYPWKEDRFKQIPLSDTLALLAASFVKDKGQPQKMKNENFFEQASMASNYHGFALMIADRSSKAADVLGLRFVDYDVKPGEVYIYSIETKRLKNNLPPIDIRVVNDFEPLLAPEGFSILKSEKYVTLQWLSSNSNLTSYGSYIVERQMPGDSVFHVLTNPPLVFIKDNRVSQPYYQFVDSLRGKLGVFRYRIKGSNAFGEWSEYAYGLGYSIDITPPEAVSIYAGGFQEDSMRLRIAWTLPKDKRDIKYHQVLLSENHEYNYSAISTELPPRDTVFFFSVKNMFTDRPFYFKVMSVDSFGNQSQSILRYVSVPDLEIPLPPTNFKVSIDTTGEILATWSPSKSHDVQGYYIFYSNNDGTDLTLQNSLVHNDTSYTWTIPLNTLTKNIYIGIKAEDDNYNRSNITDIVQLRRPDKIAPPKPFLTQVLLDEDEKVYLSWKNSSASDVVKYNIYRKNNKDSIPEWIFIDSVSNLETDYYDIKYPSNTQLSYAIKAVDDFKNISEISNPIPIDIPFPKNKYLISFQKILVSKGMTVDMEWNALDKKKLDITMPYSYQLFRSTGNDELEFFKEFNANENSFKDTIDIKNVLYNYAIRVKFDAEKYGTLSEIKSVIIQ